MTTIILWFMHFIPGLCLRATEEAETLGIDDTEMYVAHDAEGRPEKRELLKPIDLSQSTTQDTS